MKPRSEFNTTKEFLQQFAFKMPINKHKKPNKKHKWHERKFDCGICGNQIFDCVVCDILYCPGCDEKVTCK